MYRWRVAYDEKLTSTLEDLKNVKFGPISLKYLCKTRWIVFFTFYFLKYMFGHDDTHQVYTRL